MPSTFSADQLDRLKAFRLAATHVRASSVISSGATISLSGSADARSGVSRVSAVLLGTEPFRSLAMAVRLVYMNGEPSNFGSVCNQLRQGADPQYHDVIDGMRERYNNVVNSKAIRYDL